MNKPRYRVTSAPLGTRLSVFSAYANEHGWRNKSLSIEFCANQYTVTMGIRV